MLIDPREQRATQVGLPRGNIHALGASRTSRTLEHLRRIAGALIAVQDAVVLVDELQREQSVTTALDAFMARRYERCKMLVDACRQVGEWQKAGRSRSRSPAVERDGGTRRRAHAWADTPHGTTIVPPGSRTPLLVGSPFSECPPRPHLERRSPRLSSNPFLSRSDQPRAGWRTARAVRVRSQHDSRRGPATEA